MLEHSGVQLTGAKAAVLGRSRIVGMPMSLMLAGKGVDALGSGSVLSGDAVSGSSRAAHPRIAGILGLLPSDPGGT